jgi:exportin-T
VKALGTDILPYLPTLVNALLQNSQITELLDVLPFIGLIVHKFKVADNIS